VGSAHDKTLAAAIEKALAQEILSEPRRKTTTIKTSIINKPYCSDCKLTGHTNAQCFKKNQPGPSNEVRNNNFGFVKKCEYCGRVGHVEAECRTKASRQTNNQSNQTPRLPVVTNFKQEPTCNYCKEPGHIVFDCPRRPQNLRNNNNNQNNNNNGTRKKISW
jgi:hypothetical protein